MFQNLINFIYTSTPGEFRCYQRKANAIVGDITIPYNVDPIIEALKNRFGLKTEQVFFARKLLWASNKRHYKYNTTMIEDIKAGNCRRWASSYQ